MDEEVLQDSAHREVIRIGNTVHRPVHTWSASIHELLNHLENVGFPYSPRFLGFDDQGREVVSYIAGESGASGWYKVHSDEGLQSFAHLLKEYHDAVESFRSQSTEWASGTCEMKPNDIVSHGDFGPWNVVWQENKPVGLIDWDYAHPAPRRFDIAYALEYITPFRSDELCISWMHHPSVPDRARRVRVFVEAYGDDPALDWAGHVIQVQEEAIDLVRELADSGAEPQATWVRDGYLDQLHGYLQWSKANRHLFQ